MPHRKKIIVIGGGPAGLMAAGQAALNGAETVLFEKMKRTGRKLCITGKGRCNITNIAEIHDFIGHFNKSGKFLRQAFTHYFNTDLMSFFEKQGLPISTERGGRVFPTSGKAMDVHDVLYRWVKQSGAQIRQSSSIDTLHYEDGCISGVSLLGSRISCNGVILATGGISYSATGSSGDGYRLAKSLGHKIIPLRPALVPLETVSKIPAQIAGLNLRNIQVNVFVDKKKKCDAFGEMNFTDFGVSGPVILTISGKIVDYLNAKQKVSFSIDLKPALDDKKLDARLQRDFSTRGREKLSSVLRGILPRQLVPVCLELTNVAGDRLASEINAKERKKLRLWLKNFNLEIRMYRPIEEAIVTAGGIHTKEVNPRTMESHLIKGLYFAGEILDIHADTGGYNLQAAFSTGWLAGTSAARSD